MHIQASAQTGARIPPMPELAPGPLGAVGNLRFTPQENGTASANHTSVPSFDSSMADLRLELGIAPRDARVQLRHCIKVRENSRLVGNLLGNLTAPANDACALTRIAKNLEVLSKLCHGNLYDFIGGEQALHTYLKALTYPDLIALCDGIFNHPQAYEAVLEQISPAELRVQARSVLFQVGAHTLDHFAHVAVSEPLNKIAEMLNVTPVDGKKLAAQLVKVKLHSAPAAIGKADIFSTDNTLDIYFQSLSKNELDARIAGLQDQKLRAAENALHKLSDSPEKRRAIAMLERLGKSLGRESYERAQPGLKELENRLARAKNASDGEAREAEAWSIMASLHQELDSDLFKWAPSEAMVEHVSRLMQECQDLILEVRDRAIETPPA